MTFARCFPWLALAVAGTSHLLLAACSGDDDSAADDDDSTVADDDDTVADDDDAGDDDDTGDDDTGDDDDTVQDWVDATVPDASGCAGNSALVILGDGTALAAASGLVALPVSYANSNGNFEIRIGTDGLDGAGHWVAITGSTNGLSSGQTFSLGDSNLRLQTWVGADHLAGSPAELSGAYGVPPINPAAQVGGSVQFTTAPTAGGGATSGTFSGTLQKTQAQLGQTILLGVAGCFDATLAANR